MSCGVSGCDVVVASGKKNGQGVTTLPVFFKAAKITSRVTGSFKPSGLFPPALQK
ncbi:hypothetical protein EC2719100_2495 [Escherichia coli 2719100]|nr:hypothetical protein ECP03018671_2386 [Escherichia coli P0301867.1]EMX86411.1 hypothetical protein EC2719100_2495 [Escherichia coli 2719100]ENA39619.1 hypothetical protein ECP03018674_2278 [Escherichia coli P0301867.4]ENA45016.1 hypothetical protein ECP03018672_2324 [Escherichia coli P0301867.2]ENA62462.1 hypothetical protein EC178900_2183 [Escherichia coli 178900]ENC91395.1 hypothetical protein ECP030186711_2305 [Escherichia coli P0301867.11]ENC97348.1 hypothetical protein ECP03018678_222